ncbi:Diphthamide biosynthesis protein 4 [Friedmanniomyces endolithicus]|nr:Diphthamide biosynthesis protein 4 [Friedmanniomyces endolithicus]
MSDYYSILGLPSELPNTRSSQQELKTAYHRALLKHHPDRVAGGTPPPSRSTVTVDEITQAYKTLSDPDSRAEYDRLLAQSTTDKPRSKVHHTGLEVVDLDSLAFDEQAHTWSRSCRCGDRKGFVVTESELEKHIEDGELMIGCKGCSLWLRVLFGVDDGA